MKVSDNQKMAIVGFLFLLSGFIDSICNWVGSLI